MKGIKLTLREKIVGMTDNVWFQLVIMIVVLIDVISILIFEFMDARGVCAFMYGARLQCVQRSMVD